ncbi:MAG: DNA polymerase I [Flavobacteriaceae bacterium]
MQERKKIYFIDAYALIFRGYYAFIKNPIVNSKGFNTSAIYGFMNSLLDLIKRENPKYVGVCFDKGGSTSRSEIFSDYKANRLETPEAITLGIPYIKKILTAMDIPTVEMEGYEADDIIGTLAKKAEKDDFTVFMVTPDKDFAQLVSKNIFIYKPARMGNDVEIMGIKEVNEKFEIENPKQVIDYLGMVGDSVDNIPGLQGVGDKTAKKFIKEFGSIENLLKNTDKIKGKLREKIEANRDLGLLSKKLAKIILNVPVDFEKTKFKLELPDSDRLNMIFEELEFKRIKETTQKIFFGINKDLGVIEETKISETKEGLQTNMFDNSMEDKSGELKKLDTLKHYYQTINTSLGFDLFLNKLLKQNIVSFDTETTSLNALKAELVGIAFSWERGTGYYLPFPENRNQCKALILKLKPFFENEKIKKIGHNLKYDIKVLTNYSVYVQGPLYDTMIAHYLINPDGRHNLDFLAEKYLNYKCKPISDLIGPKGRNQKNMRDVLIEDQKEYAVEDADITLQLKSCFDLLNKDIQNEKLLNEVEFPLIKVLSKMESEGFNLDSKFLGKMETDLNKEIKGLEEIIFQSAGESFNLSSPKQLGLVLFEKLKLVDKPKKTRTGQYSTSEEVLSLLAKKHKIIDDILNWRSLNKLQTTYVKALPSEVNSKTNRIHTVFNQAVASTGRLTSNKPNLQNIPVRTKKGQLIRKAFIPRDKNHLIICADYSQIELRIIASLSEDLNMIKAFKEGKDIHLSTAAKVYNIPEDSVTRRQRSNAKTVNFGIIYGVSAFGLSQQTDLNRIESKEMIDTYYKSYPKLKEYMSSQIQYARENGFVSTLLKRRRYLKDINSQNAIVRGAAERTAINAPVQGSAADIIKLAMIQIDKKIHTEKLQSRMILQVHDELVFDVPKEEKDVLSKIVKIEMENALELKVPLVVDLETGENWLEAH